MIFKISWQILSETSPFGFPGNAKLRSKSSKTQFFFPSSNAKKLTTGIFTDGDIKRVIQNKVNIKIIRNQTKLPLIIDAGLGQASDATIAMELGCDGVLVNLSVK